MIHDHDKSEFIEQVHFLCALCGARLSIASNYDHEDRIVEEEHHLQPKLLLVCCDDDYKNDSSDKISQPEYKHTLFLNVVSDIKFAKFE